MTIQFFHADSGHSPLHISVAKQQFYACLIWKNKPRIFSCWCSIILIQVSGGSSDAELVRLSHKKYAPHQKKFFRQPRKSYSWTWRFKQDVIVQKKVELTRIINRIVSQPKKDKALNDLRVWQKYMNTYAVFRGNRQQAGRLYTFGKKFYYSRTQQKWDVAQLPQLNLSFIKRYKTYAESYEEYDLRRYVYMTCGEELPRDISKTLNKKEAQNFMGKFL
ncbi:hypothetical protein [Acinetobacter ursingii]|uniref:hypothetical protein n=1 Tax=Acinetobacter ursingii TaxID=108980 RepID=UPI00300B5C1A